MASSPFPFQAEKLYHSLVGREDIVILDVRNEEDFQRLQVESPYPFEMMNLPCFDFMEEEDTTVTEVPRDKPVRIVCAKEGSARYVGEILMAHGFEDVGYLGGGIRSWGEMLAHGQSQS